MSSMSILRKPLDSITVEDLEALKDSEARETTELAAIMHHGDFFHLSGKPA